MHTKSLMKLITPTGDGKYNCFYSCNNLDRSLYYIRVICVLPWPFLPCLLAPELSNLPIEITSARNFHIWYKLGIEKETKVKEKKKIMHICWYHFQTQNSSWRGFHCALKREDHLGPDNSSGGMWDEESTIQLVFAWWVWLNSWRNTSSCCHSSHLSAKPSPSSILTTSDILGRSIGELCVHSRATWIRFSTSSSM